MRTLRNLLRAPRLTLAALLCVAVGAAAVGSMATLVRATLLRPLPFPDGERLVRVWSSEAGAERLPLSYPLASALREGAGSLGAFEITARARLLVFGGDSGRRVEGEAVTPGYFDLLGVEPVVGRLFTPEEHRPGGAGVVVIAHALWGERFGFTDDVIGGVLPTEAGPLEVVGVLPAGFRGTVEDDAGEIELWLPVDGYLDEAARGSWTRGGIWAIGRLRPEVAIGAAAAEIEGIGRRLAADQPEALAGRRLTVEPLGENWRAGLRRGSWLLLGAALGLLLVAALNVSALFLARALERRREWSVERALGASARSLVGVVVAEALVVVALGGALGAWLGQLALPRLLAAAGIVLPDYVRAEPDPVAAAAVVAVLGLAGLIAALAPVRVALRTDPGAALREGGRGQAGARGTRRLWSGLVLAEVALSMVLASGAVVLVRSWHGLLGEDLGFRTDRMLRLALFLGPDQVSDPEALLPFLERARDELAGEPGVAAAALVWPTIPIWGAVQETVRWPEMPAADRERGHRVAIFMGDEHLLPTLEVPLLAGRGFRPGEAARVAVVSRSLARRLGGVADAVGRRLELGDGDVRVVGVMADVAFGGARERQADRETLLLPLAASPARYATFMIRTTGDPGERLPGLARALGGMAPASALDWSGTLDYWLAERYRDARFAPVLLGTFAGAALIITAVGLFALISAGVARGRAEIGVRLALGASPRWAAAAVVRRSVALAGLGVLLGGAVAAAAGDLLATLLHQVGPRDPLSFLIAGGTMLAIAALAAWLPARRAARVDPMGVLRG